MLSMPIAERPNRPPVTQRSVLPAPPVPANISAIAADPASIGNIIMAWPHARPLGGGIAGGASRISSPSGNPGAGRRGGRLTMTVPTDPPSV
ncbi:hypothetical protein GCM10009539_57390 [Cryptosporangium japonicum]|uniref:Uncharacterized protein n=1 Tax=Cryptosporangium japonicum TaxID=80872 RepID=A0ABN0UWL3_9ACTN